MKTQSRTNPMPMPAALMAAALIATPCFAALPPTPADPTTLEGKVLFGYQGWFDCNSSGTGAFGHWGNPSTPKMSVEMYPELGEIAPQDLCPAGKLTIAGKQAYLYSAKSAKVVDAHFRWMEEYGLDGVLVQRFLTDVPGRVRGGDVVLKNIMAAALAHKRVFAIEYDVSGAQEGNFAQLLQADWKYLVDELKVTANPFYLRHGGKPLVSVWGPGLPDAKHPPSSAAALQAFMGWFRTGPAQYQAAYMGGTGGGWGTLSGDSRTGQDWAEVYKTMDVIQPWTIGRYSDTTTAKNWGRNKIVPDMAKVKANGNMYMPVIFPGFSWANLMAGSRQNQIPRLGGKFLWKQAYTARAAGASMLKIAMFDEVNEGTAMFKMAPTRAGAPEQGYWLTLDADGYKLPSDWYLRMAREVTALFHGTRPLSVEMPLDPANPAASLISRTGGMPGSGSISRTPGGYLFQNDASAGWIRIFTPQGKSVKALEMKDGRVLWDGTDKGGARLPAGIYLASVENRGGKDRTFSPLILP
jgi:hypothetical protein